MITTLLPLYVGLMILGGIDLPVPAGGSVSPSASQQHALQAVPNTACGMDQPIHQGMAASSNVVLKKLAEYESVCQSAIADQMMFFAGMPANAEEVEEQASYVAAALKEFHKFGVQPLVIFEPNSDSANMFETKEGREGKFNVLLDEYFKTLKVKGVTDAMMGTWVPFPEFNTPMWFSTDPGLFSANVTTAAQVQKYHFPGSKASIMLNSQTYPSHDENWEFGAYASLVPYVKDIPKGLLDSIGYQGFPWASPANAPYPRKLFNAAEFLRPDLIKEAASELGVTKVWLNTGTFHRSHASDPQKTVTIDAQTRKDILHNILVQGLELKNAGLSVSINLFAEDKTHANEGVDWSYWQQGDPSGGDATPIFKEFVTNVRHHDLDFSLYDAYHR